MLKLWMMLTCILFLGSMGTSQAAPLDSSDIVYIDGLPCNRACQSYMAWYRQATTPPQTAPVPAQLDPPEVAEQLPKAAAQRTPKARDDRPKSASPTRVAKKAAPKPIEAPPAKDVALAKEVPSATEAPPAKEAQLATEAPPAKEVPQAKEAPLAKDLPPAQIADLPPADRGEEAKSATPEKIVDSPPISNPVSGSDGATTPQQVATAPAADDLPTAKASPAPEQKADSNTKPPAPAEAVPAADAETTALASPNVDDRLVAILLVRPEIKSVSDLANKIVAIDARRSESVPSVRTAIAAAGAADVQMSEGEALALNRVMDGEVPAAVVTLTSPDEAEMWSAGMPGLRVLRIPLSPPSEKARRG